MATLKRKSVRKKATPKSAAKAGSLKDDPEIPAPAGFDDETGAPTVRLIVRELEFNYDDEGECYVAWLGNSGDRAAKVKAEWSPHFDWGFYKRHRDLFHAVSMKPLKDEDGTWWMEWHPDGLPKYEAPAPRAKAKSKAKAKTKGTSTAGSDPLGSDPPSEWNPKNGTAQYLLGQMIIGKADDLDSINVTEVVAKAKEMADLL